MMRLDIDLLIAPVEEIEQGLFPRRPPEGESGNPRPPIATT
jgi:hypothetical protein